ncbi:MAG: hypothetical protein CFE24_09610 [Flavobacterium sp. BFFFF2]|nr:MAG: hypothetical protein CFE24_09610 [Flavobacterium sp. BFFFF2]
MRIFILFLYLSFLQVNGQTLQKKTFPLPEIKALKYVSIPSALARIFPPNACQDRLIGLLKSYHQKFKNINGHEVYLVKQSCEFSQNTCLCFKTIAQGDFDFLILYNPKTKQAAVFVASYDFLSDSEVYLMHFKINKNEITLRDVGFTEGENGKAEAFSKNIIKVRILKNGEVTVKAGKR